MYEGTFLNEDTFARMEKFSIFFLLSLLSLTLSLNSFFFVFLTSNF